MTHKLFAKKSKVRIPEKIICSYKPYNFLKTIAFRLEIPFAYCYSDISYLLILKNTSRMKKKAHFEFRPALVALCSVPVTSVLDSCHECSGWADLPRTLNWCTTTDSSRQ